jgi:ABC-type sugar transport system ATPase subunit
MAFSLKLKGAPKGEIQQKVNRAAEILGLTPLLERYPRQLSGGQRQRVAMGRAIVRDPQVFLFDEPLSNLDAKLRVQMRSEIKALHQRLSTTTVYVTHDQVEAMTMADRIVVMQDGRVEQVGAPLELYDRPANLFVATFIGSPAMNLIEGRITGEGFVTTSGLTLPLASAPAGSQGQPALYGIRPEHFSLGGREWQGRERQRERAAGEKVHPGRGRGRGAHRLRDPGGGNARRPEPHGRVPRARPHQTRRNPHPLPRPHKGPPVRSTNRTQTQLIKPVRLG